jgi:hypothetical protein
VVEEGVEKEMRYGQHVGPTFLVHSWQPKRRFIANNGNLDLMWPN